MCTHADISLFDCIFKNISSKLNPHMSMSGGSHYLLCETAQKEHLELDVEQ